jgi:hypothetical protein
VCAHGRFTFQLEEIYRLSGKRIKQSGGGGRQEIGLNTFQKSKTGFAQQPAESYQKNKGLPLLPSEGEIKPFVWSQSEFLTPQLLKGP